MAPEEENVNPEGNTDETGSGDQDDKTFDETYVKELREEAKKYRLKLRETEEAKKQLEDEKLTETEKEKKRLKELEDENNGYKSKLKQIELNSKIVKTASSKGFVDMELVELLAQRELASEDEVKQKDIEKVIDKIAKDKPYLIAEEGSVSTGTTGNTPKQDIEPSKKPDDMLGEFLKS